MYNKYNAPKVDRLPMTDRLRKRVGEYKNLYKALIIYMNNIKDEMLGTFEGQVNDIFNRGKEVALNEKLEGLTLDGVKPDAYILVRNGQLIVDFSYHYFLRVVAERYNKKIDTVLLERDHIQAIESVDPINQTIVFNTKKYTEMLFNSDSFALDKCAACVVNCKDIATKEISSVVYRVGDLRAAGSAHTGSSFALTAGTDALKHKNIMMIRKTAIRMYIRDNFTDLRDMPDIDYPENNMEATNAQYNEEPQEYKESELLKDLKQKLESVETLDELNVVSEIIKKHGLTSSERMELVPIFAERKQFLASCSTL